MPPCDINGLILNAIESVCILWLTVHAVNVLPKKGKSWNISQRNSSVLSPFHWQTESKGSWVNWCEIVKILIRYIQHVLSFSCRNNDRVSFEFYCDNINHGVLESFVYVGFCFEIR